MLIKGMTAMYPQLRIVGEEDVEYQGNIDVDYTKLNKYQLPAQIKLQKQYRIQDVCVWIDPIDNTKGFISGEAQAVTVLIGISYQGKV